MCAISSDQNSSVNLDHEWHACKLVRHYLLVDCLLYLHRRVGQVKLEYVPPPMELVRTFAARFIFTMASSPPDQHVIKMFLYAQHVSNSSSNSSSSSSSSSSSNQGVHYYPLYWIGPLFKMVDQLISH